jgi:hypothetical protein
MNPLHHMPSSLWIHCIICPAVIHIYYITYILAKESIQYKTNYTNVCERAEDMSTGLAIQVLVKCSLETVPEFCRQWATYQPLSYLGSFHCHSKWLTRSLHTDSKWQEHGLDKSSLFHANMLGTLGMNAWRGGRLPVCMIRHVTARK